MFSYRAPGKLPAVQKTVTTGYSDTIRVSFQLRGSTLYPALLPFRRNDLRRNEKEMRRRVKRKDAELGEDRRGSRSAARQTFSGACETRMTRGTLHWAILIVTFHKEFLSEQRAERWMQNLATRKNEDEHLETDRRRKTEKERERETDLERRRGSEYIMFIRKLIKSLKSLTDLRRSWIAFIINTLTCKYNMMYKYVIKFQT